CKLRPWNPMPTSWLSPSIKTIAPAIQRPRSNPPPTDLRSEVVDTRICPRHFRLLHSSTHVNGARSLSAEPPLHREVRMAKPPASSTLSAAARAALRALILRRPGPIFDPIDMEPVLQIDRTLGKQLLPQRLEPQAEVSRVVADASAKAAKLLK